MPGDLVKNQDLGDLHADLVRAARAMGPTWMVGNAEDVAQEVILRLIERSRQGEGNVEDGASYWRKAALHEVVDRIRRRRRRPEESLSSNPVGVANTQSRAPDPERSALQGEIGRAIGDCLGEITQGRRLAVALYLQGHTIREAASVLGWHQKRTESLLYRGLGDLRLCLRGKGVHP